MRQFLHGVFYDTRKNALRRGINFDLTLEEFDKMADRQGNRCRLTGIPFTWRWEGAGRKRPWAASIDRIDSKKDYTYNNVRIVCVAANLAMNEWGFYVLKKMAEAICDRVAESQEVDQFEVSNINPVEVLPQEAPVTSLSLCKAEGGGVFAGYLTRRNAAAYVTQKGLNCAPTTLGKLACIGGGPLFRKFGRTPVYLASDLDVWIQNRISDPMASSSKACVAV